MRWTIGAADAGPGDGVVALTLDELRAGEAAGATVVRIDELLAGAEVEPADEVSLSPRKWRGHSFIALCEWLVCAKLAAPGAAVTWTAPVRGGATGVRKVLSARSWEARETRRRDERTFEGVAPAPGEMPKARTFTAQLGPQSLRFEADWGVFSSEHIDDGTRVLYEAASGAGPVGTVVDVGTGYGPVAIGLAASGVCKRAFGSDVDFVALYLAGRNAAAAHIEMKLAAQDDPAALRRSELTTCEIPTHTSDAQTNRLVEGLARRAATGRVLVAVHNSLAARYVRLFTAAGTSPRVEDGDTHAILSIG